MYNGNKHSDIQSYNLTRLPDSWNTEQKEINRMCNRAETFLRAEKQ